MGNLVCLETDKWKKTKHMISSLLAGTSYLRWPSSLWNHRLGLRAGGSGEYGEKGQRRTLEEGVSERLGTEQKDGKGHYGGREIKAWKRRSSPRLRQIWKIIVLVGLKKNKQKSLYSLGAAPLHNSGCNRILSLCCFSISKYHLIYLSHWMV